MTLRQRFALVVVAFALAVAGVGGAFALGVTTRALEEELDEKLLWTVGAVAGAALPGSDTEWFFRGEEDSALWLSWRTRLRALLPYVEEAYVFHRDMYALHSTRPPEELPIGTPMTLFFAYPSALAQAWEEGQATTELFRGDDGTLYKYAFHRLGDSDAMLGVLVRTDFLDPVSALRRNLILGTILSVILAAIVAFLLAAGVARPMERLSRAAIRIQRGQWDRPIEEEGGDEVGRLSRAMERMRVGIVQRDDQLRLMLAQVAHEIRNPLGGLELFASAALEAEDEDERNRILSRIRGEVEGLNGIIQEFLAFSRPMEPVVELHDVRVPLEDAASLLEIELDEHGGEIRVELPATPLLARADADHVKRIVLNLLRNAAHAGRIVRLSAAWWNGEVRIEVADDGPGIPETMKDRIFEPFVTDKEQGAGLGLAIVQRLSQVNGGRVELAGPEESEGGGAIFRVYLQGSEELIMDGE
jgi:signal transduction histidine kinase